MTIMRMLHRAALGMTLISWGGVTSLALGKTAPANNSVVVTDAWVRAVKSPQTTTALYGRIQNISSQPVTIIGVGLEGAAHSELHKSMVDTKGVASMEQQKEVTIRPGEALILAPGGYHGMMMGLKTSLMTGSKIKASVMIKEAPSEISFEAVVK